jgi:hypothetical protein
MARWKNLDMSIPRNRWTRARQLAKSTGADVDVVEQMLFLQTLQPLERLARGLMRARLGRYSHVR